MFMRYYNPIERLFGVNSDHTQSGQKTRISSARIIPGDVQRAAEQAANALSIEAGKK